MVDEALLLRKLAELDEYLKQVSEYSDITVKEYYDDWKSQRIIERTLQMMLETCVDIAGHIISDEEYRIPKSYADTFRVLHENNILDEKFFQTMDKMAKFRNIVVHHYDKVDAEIVIGILRRNLADFSRYKDAIIRFLESSKSV